VGTVFRDHETVDWTILRILVGTRCGRTAVFLLCW